MYTSKNFKTKKALKDAVDAWNKQEAADRAKEASTIVVYPYIDRRQIVTINL